MGLEAVHVRDVHVQGVEDDALAGLGHVGMDGDGAHYQVGRLQLCAHFKVVLRGCEAGGQVVRRPAAFLAGIACPHTQQRSRAAQAAHRALISCCYTPRLGINNIQQS